MSKEDRFKFRYWSKVCNCFFVERHKGIDDPDKAGSLHIFEDIVKNADFIIVMTTGKKDKNGKHIFEGDFLKEKFTDPDTQKDDFNIFQILYDENNCCFYQQAVGFDYREGFPEYDFKEENVEVIGNIYENPELLKEGRHG